MTDTQREEFEALTGVIIDGVEQMPLGTDEEEALIREIAGAVVRHTHDPATKMFDARDIKRITLVAMRAATRKAMERVVQELPMNYIGESGFNFRNRIKEWLADRLREEGK